MTLGPSGNGKDLRKGILYSVFGGAGFGVFYALIEVLKSDPKAMISMVGSLLGQWGPVFTLACVALFFVDRRLGDGLQVLRDNTAAQQSLADAVQQIAKKDDERGIALELVTSRMARDTREVLDALHEIRQHLGMNPEKANGHTAGQ